MKDIETEFLDKILDAMDPLAKESDDEGKHYCWFTVQFLTAALMSYFLAFGREFDRGKLIDMIDHLKKVHDNGE